MKKGKRSKKDKAHHDPYSQPIKLVGGEVEEEPYSIPVKVRREERTIVVPCYRHIEGGE